MAVVLKRPSTQAETFAPYERRNTLVYLTIVVCGVVGIVVFGFLEDWFGSIVVVGFCTAVALGLAWLVLSFVTPYRDEKLDAGDAGEEAVVHHLERFLDDSYTVVADVYVPRAGKKPAQVDAIVVGPTGLFVLEVKNWSGVIRPVEGERWARFRFNRCLGWGVVRDVNPVRQNAGHVLAVKEYVGEGCPWAHNLIVMANPNSRLESPVKGAKVLRLPELAGYISGLRERIPQEAVDLVASRLKEVVEAQSGLSV